MRERSSIDHFSCTATVPKDDIKGIENLTSKESKLEPLRIGFGHVGVVPGQNKTSNLFFNKFLHCNF